MVKRLVAVLAVAVLVFSPFVQGQGQTARAEHEAGHCIGGLQWDGEGCVDKLEICHATGSGYVTNTPSRTGDVEGHAGESHQDGRDIIPPFDYEGGSFPGQNWDAEGQAIYNDGACDGDSETEPGSGSITVIKVVINDSGTGTSTVSDFPLFIEDDSVTSGETVTLPAGSYTVSETNKDNYSATFSGDCDANGNIGLEADEEAECTITNNDIPEGGSSTSTPIACSFEPQEGRTIVTFDPEKKLRSDQGIFANSHVSGPEPVSLAAGTYDVSLMSYDDNGEDQSWEQWQVVFKSGSTTVATSSAIDDLPDGPVPRTLSQMVDSDLVLSDDVDEVLAWHAFWPNETHDSYSPNSVHPVCAAFDRIDGGSEPQDDLKVHIYKYLDGKQANATTSAGYQFPMTATWDAANLGSGTGSYVLGNGEGGAAEQYAADTSLMSSPADYTTSEITTASDSSSKVLPIGAECSEGKYRLQGYTSGPTFSEAESGTPTSSAPVFNDVTSDRYVIVWNEICPADEENPEVAASIELLKSGSFNSDTGNVTFTLDWRVLGTSAVSDLVINDPIATSTAFVSAGQGGALNSGSVTWNLGSQAASATGTLSFVLQPTATGTLPCSLDNTAFATASFGTSTLAASSSATVILNQSACGEEPEENASSTVTGTIGGNVGGGNLTGTVTGGGGGGSSRNRSNGGGGNNGDNGAGQILGASDSNNPADDFAPGQVLGASLTPGFPSTGEMYEGRGQRGGGDAAIAWVLVSFLALVLIAPLSGKEKEKA